MMEVPTPPVWKTSTCLTRLSRPQIGIASVCRAELTKIITSISSGVLKPLTELITLGRTRRRGSADVLAYFDRGTSNGPTEAINGRHEHLRGTALGFRNLATYIWLCQLQLAHLRRPDLDPVLPRDEPCEARIALSACPA